VLEELTAQRREVLTLVGALREVARALGASSLVQHLTQDVEAKLEADRFFLVVVGEFNHGKTALVNALLGEEVLPVGVTPTTAVIHQLSYADAPSARVVRPSGEIEAFPLESLADFASGKARAGESVAHVEIGYPAELLRERVVLVDTPGVNDLSLTRADITYGYLPRADAVLFVLDAGQPLKESEREFLEKQLDRAGRDNLLFVINKSDLWTEEEQAEALAYVRQRLADLLEEPAVFAVSAKAALSGEAEKSGMQELSQQVTQLLTQQRGRGVRRRGTASCGGSAAARGQSDGGTTRFPHRFPEAGSGWTPGSNRRAAAVGPGGKCRHQGLGAQGPRAVL